MTNVYCNESSIMQTSTHLRCQLAIIPKTYSITKQEILHYKDLQRKSHDLSKHATLMDQITSSADAKVFLKGIYQIPIELHIGRRSYLLMNLT